MGIREKKGGWKELERKRRNEKEEEKRRIRRKKKVVALATFAVTE